jgi:hypothetical protein
MKGCSSSCLHELLRPSRYVCFDRPVCVVPAILKSKVIAVTFGPRFTCNYPLKSGDRWQRTIQLW